MSTARHPAKYTDSFLPLFAELLRGYDRVLDPLAGTCKLGHIRELGYNGEIWCNELEPEWAMQAPYGTFVHIGDASRMPFESRFFDAICTSPTYGNRMADHHNARDGSKRNTYTHVLGRQLKPSNTGAMQWGKDYQLAHIHIWTECRRVLKPGGRFILNVKNHIRKGEVVPVTEWHIDTLERLGFTLEEHRKIETPSLRYGANSKARLDYESIIVMRRGE